MSFYAEWGWSVTVTFKWLCAPTAKVVWFSYAHMYKMRGREQTWPNIQCQRVYRSSLYSFSNFSMYLKTLKVGKRGTLVLTMYWGYLPKVCCCSKQMYLSTPVIYLVLRLRRWGNHKERDCQKAVYTGVGTVCPPPPCGFDWACLTSGPQYGLLGSSSRPALTTSFLSST